MGDEMWKTFDFKPAPVGWRVAFRGKDPSQNPEMYLMPGWLMQARSVGPVIHHERDVRVVPAVFAQGEVVHIQEAEEVYGTFLGILGPEDPDPGPVEALSY